MQPALAIYPTEDPVADWVHASKLLQSERYVPNLVVEVCKVESRLLHSSNVFCNIRVDYPRCSLGAN